MRLQLLNFNWGKTLPCILQTEQTECGLACLAMVLNYHGHRIDINTLRNKYSISQQGVTLKTLMHIADKAGLAARPLRLEMNELARLGMPALLHWDMNHFVVLKAVRGGRAVVHDPATGVRHHPLREVGKHFTGVALELTPTHDFVRGDDEKRLRLRDLWTRAQGLKRNLLQLFLLSLLLQIFSLALPFYSQLFIDDVLLRRDIELLEILAAGFLLVTLVKVITELLRSFVILHLSNKVSFQFSINVFRHLLRLPVQYFSKRHMGDIVSRFGSLGNIKDFLSSGIVEILIDGLMVMGTLVIMFIYSVTLTLVAGIAVLLYTMIRMISYRAMRARNEEMISLGAVENTTFMENVRAIQGIKMFGKEADRNSVWQNCYADMMNAGIKVQKLNIGIHFAHGLLVGVENIVLILLGGYAVLNGTLSIGMVVAYISYKDQFYSRVFALLDKLFEFRLLEVHLARLADITFARPEQHVIGVGAPPPDVCLVGGLKLEDVAFRYSPDSPWLFRNINLEVANNESIAIIGPTGCGKSTLLKIMLSLYQPAEGVVSLHGMPVNQMGLGTYRERVAGVLQDDCLLSGTIFENITFFDAKPDRERVEQAANMAAIAQDIRAMPMQYQTLVGNMGSALSGGQIQRILLARAFYRYPRLLVLDEATSHLDLATERVVNASLRQLHIARVIVAHRPQSVKLADTIYRLTPLGLEPVAHHQFDSDGVPGKQAALHI